MFNVSFTRRTLRTLSCAGLATIFLASCGGGGGSDGAAVASGEQGSTMQPVSSSTSSGVSGTGGAGSSVPTDGPFGQDASAYSLSFSDEFDNGLSSDTWNDTVWYEASNPTKNYAVEDGVLKIWPQRDASGKFFNRTVDTDGKFYQTYGYFEVEAKLPIGKGTWPAFWLFNHIGDRRPEIDVMEAYAGGGPDTGWGDANLHPVAYAPTVWRDQTDMAGSKMIATPDLSAAYHKYAVKWEPNKQTFYFDGKEVYSVDVSMGDPMYLMLDLWYGSASGQPDDSTPQGKGNSYEVNYVRAWTFK